MHTIWKGAISFGLVHIPVKLYAATEEKEIVLHLLHKSCHGTIKNQRYCHSCQSVVEPEDLIKGYPLDTNQFVTFDKDELDKIHDDTSKKISILDFADELKVDLMFTQKVYFLGPDTHGANAYYLLLKALEASKKIAIGKMTLRSNTKLCVLKPINGNCIQLATMYYTNEIRPSENVPNLATNISVDPGHLKLALQIVKGLTGTSDLESYTNPEQERLLNAIQSKISGQLIVSNPAQESEVVVDLLDALQESVKLVKGKNNPKQIIRKEKLG
ncbi:Ku protein [Paenibacillus periandrae]|uniref:non-homologous end joining protein Ku n=1 Tax=Paenibacillus periandrae TaxID=1761741 RepID=UPI001F08EC83|nr:Ku protein [Paenibacillus periandrae]